MSRTPRTPTAPFAAPLVGLLAGLLVALLTASLLAAPPASAATGTIRDDRGDGAGDLTKVTVRWADALAVRVAHADRLRGNDLYSVYVDTRPGRKGPEYRAFARPDSNALGLRRVSRWNDPGSPVTCPGFRASASVFEPSAPVTFRVPGSCLGDPDGAVRVTARVVRGDAEDWAPSARRLGPPVARG